MKKMIALCLLVAFGAVAEEPVPAPIASSEINESTLGELSLEELRDFATYQNKWSKALAGAIDSYRENKTEIETALEAGYTDQERHDSAQETALTMFEGTRDQLIADRPTPQSVRASEIARIEAANAEEAAADPDPVGDPE